MNAVWVRAHAKVNLGLEIVGRRADGYHDLVSVLQAVELADTLICAPDARLLLRTAPSLPFPAETNLVWRAAALLRDGAGVRAGARLTLRKRIPIAAGLGGGSADAAAALIGLRRLWGLGGFALRETAAALGSDVPYFLGPATALVRGRGEIVEALPALPARDIVLLRPPIALPTRDVFAALRPDDWTDGATTRALAAALGRAETPVDHLLRNGLRAAAERVCPPLAALCRALQAIGLHPQLSGSGPTLFVFPAPGAAQDVGAAGRRLGAEVWVGRTIERRPVRARAWAPSAPTAPKSKGA